MTAASGILAVIVGAILAVYSVNTVCDAYWSLGTRAIGVVGTAVGIGTLVLGLWRLSW